MTGKEREEFLGVMETTIRDTIKNCQCKFMEGNGDKPGDTRVALLEAEMKNKVDTSRFSKVENRLEAQSALRKGMRDAVFVFIGLIGTIIGGWLQGREHEPKQPTHPPAKISVDTTRHAPRG